MPRPFRRIVIGIAALAAMSAFGARAERNPAAQDPPLAHAAATHSPEAGAQKADPIEAGHADAGVEAGSSDLSAAAAGTDAGAESSDFPIAGDIEALEPYKLMRSLQFVQDAVVRGDHSAMEMQRFLLGVIDSRLRTADQQVFDDPRNVDAALIYAMSGGNPETLELLAIKDKFGNFDNEVTTVLRAYLNGYAAKTKTSLAEVVEMYRDTEIGPYLTLVAANVTASMNDTSALQLFDWARLTAPGTLVEESALRRSLLIAARKNMVDEALAYAHLYARRFINSPYAGQYADLLVDLVVLNYGKVGDDRLDAILSFMDRPRKREVYLRIARKAVISGLRDLAVFASDKAETLLDPADQTPQALADLYSGMARIPTDGIDAVLAAINAVPERRLSPRDRALREAAQMIATEVLRKPDPNSLTQAFSPKMGATEQAEGAAAREPLAIGGSSAPAAELQNPPLDEEAEAAEQVFRGYVSDRKQALERIDKLLEGVEEGKGS